MDWLANILNGINGRFTLIIVLFILVQLFISIRRGTISFNRFGLQVGKTRESELRIVREQLQYLEQVLNGCLSKVPEELRTGENFYRAKYWWSKLIDEGQRMVVYNHLTYDETYIKLKQEIAYNLMISVIDDDNEYWKSPEFRGLIYNTMKELICDLVKVRETYSKKTCV